MFLTHSKSIWLWTVCKYIMYCNAGKHFTNSIRSTAKMNFKELPWKEASLLSDKLWHCLWKRRINCFNVIFIVYEIIQGTVNIIVIFKSSIHLKIKIMLQKESSLRKWWTHNRLVKSCNDEVPSTVSIHNKLTSNPSVKIPSSNLAQLPDTPPFKSCRSIESKTSWSILKNPPMQSKITFQIFQPSVDFLWWFSIICGRYVNIVSTNFTEAIR